MGFVKTSLRAILVVSIALQWTEPAQCQATVELGFDGPASLSGLEGSTVSGSYFSTLTQTSGSIGAQAWSIIMDASNASFTSVTIAGTEADALVDREPCFGLPQCSFETYQMGGGFACSAVVLSFRSFTALPASGSTTIMQVGIETVVPQCGGSVTLEYLDVGGCFAGVASTNVVTIQGQSVTFGNGLLSAAIQLLEDDNPNNDDGATPLIEAFIQRRGRFEREPNLERGSGCADRLGAGHPRYPERGLALPSPGAPPERVVLDAHPAPGPPS